MENIKCFTEDAPEVIKKFQEENNLQENRVIATWYNGNNIFCYTLELGEKVVTIALLSPCDFDPHGKCKEMNMLQFVYTAVEFRRRGFAKKLVEHIKQSKDFTAACQCEASQKLFEKAGLVNYGMFLDCVMMRTR